LGADLDHPSPIVEVRAPAEGTIVEQNVTGAGGGKSLDNSPNLFTIADLSRVWVLCDVYENNLRQVRLGDYADVQLNAYPNRTFRGRVSNISRILDPATRSAKVRLELDNPGGIMRAGMFATATFRSQTGQQRPVAPSSAILRLHDKDWVFRCEGEKRFRRTEIQAGVGSRGGYQEVLAGLRPGDRIVLNALQFASATEQYVIRSLGDFALHNRMLVMALSFLLLVWGVISFHQRPVEAYPDVANTYVNIITQWPGRAAEEVEQQVTIPIETQVNGVPFLTNLRSVSLFGLSSVTLIFEDGTDTLLARQQVLEKLSQANLPQNLTPTLGPNFSPVGQIYFYTLVSANPRYDLMELKALNDWVIVKQLKSVPNIVDVSSFGGVTREYQVQIDPNKLISYGVSLAQVEQALANNNVNAGGSFIEHGQQAFNVRAVGLMNDVP